MGTQNEKAVIDLVINGQQSQATMKQLTAATIDARKALYSMSETDPGYKRQKKELEDLMRAQQARIVRINEEKTAWQKFTAGMPSITAGVVGANLLTAGISAIGSVIPAAVAQFRAFNAASQDLSAVTGATGQDLAYLNQQAKQTGPGMGKAADQMLEAYKLMASAKPELLDQKELLVETTKAAITLSQAGRIELAPATSITAESLNQFGESADQANRFINVIAAGAKEGSAEIADMGIALKNSGTVAAAQNVSFEQTNAILQSMSTIALKGGEAGTQLRNVLLTLGSGSDDTNPRIVGLEKALENLGKKNLSTAEMTKLFGKENITAAQHIITHRNEIAALTTKITGTSEAFTQAAKNNESFDHQMEIFWARMNGIATLIGTRLIPAVTSLVEGGISLAKFMTGSLTPASEAATQAFEDQRAKVASLNQNLTPLLARHDELRRKTSLTRTEQSELKNIVGQVANIVPSAVTEFDKYGRALGINTDKARDFIKIQKELLKFNNKKAIDETADELASKIQQRDAAVAKLRVGSVNENLGMGVNRRRKMSDDEMRAIQADIAKVNDEISALEARKKGLTGDYLETPSKSATLPKPKAETGTGSGPTDKEKKAAEAQVTANEMAKLAIEQRNVKAITDERERELAQAKFEADQEIERARKSKATGDLKATWIKGIEDALVVEKAKIEEKYTKKKNEETEKQMAAQRKAAEEELELEKAKQLAKIQMMVADGDLTKETGEQAKLMAEETFLQAKLLLNEAHYQSLAELYQKDKDKLAEIALEKKNAVSKITGEITENEADQSTARASIADAEVKGNQDAARQQAQDNKNLFRAKREIFNDSVTVLKSFFKENTIAYKAAFIAQQAWALGEVAVNYSRAVMASVAASAGIPFPGNLLAIAKSLAIPTLQAGAAVANIRAQKFDAPAFEDGGFTNSDQAPAGYTSGPTYYNKGNFIAGEAGTEWIMSAPMLKNPVMANLAGALQALQSSGQWRSLSPGGSVRGGSSASPGGGGSDSESKLILLQIHQQLQLNNQKMDAVAARPISNDFLATERLTKEVSTIRQVTGL